MATSVLKDIGVGNFTNLAKSCYPNLFLNIKVKKCIEIIQWHDLNALEENQNNRVFTQIR